MKMLKEIILLLIGFLNFSFAQGEGTLPLTTVQQSVLLLGAGQIGAAIPNDDVLGFYYNPAILGYSARNNHTSFSFMPDKTEWVFGYIKPTFNNFGFNLGYNLKYSKVALPITIGVGYIHNKFDFGKSTVRTAEHPEGIGEVENYDLFDCFSIGMGIDYYLKFNMGISLKSFDSRLGARVVNGKVEPYSVDGTMFDYGTLLIFPISDLLMKNVNFKLDELTLLKPTTNISLGYSLTNVGDEIYYVEPAQSDPLSRTARLGYTFDIGMDIIFKDNRINFFNYSFTAEAEDILIDYNIVSHQFKYQDAIGDINFSDHLINLKSDEKVIVHKGHILKFFDTVIFTLGSFHGRGYPTLKETNGLGLTSNGIFRLLSYHIQAPTVNYFLKHFTIEYFDASVEFWKVTNFDGLSIHFKGFEL